MRDIQMILKNHILKMTNSFIDDIEMKKRKKKRKSKEKLSLIFEVRQSIFVYIQRLNEVLADLKRFKFTISADKSQFCCDEIRIVKYICDENERHFDIAKVIKILN